ncbi:MAG: OmpH family outer membrane protein [Bacteroidales bacterium]|jgi:outer membrane protein|nr:OmpH family outer membrane protein [Bacteroidales bacterium]
MEENEKLHQNEQAEQDNNETNSAPIDNCDNDNENREILPENKNDLFEMKPECSKKKKQKTCILQITGYGIVAVAVIVLYVLHFLQPQPFKPMPVRTGDSSQSLIVTVNTDSLMEHFVLAKLLKDDLEKETENYQKELQKKSADFESKYQNYMINVQNNVLTQTQMQNAEKQLIQEKESLEALSERYTKILVDKEMSVQNEIMDSLKNATKRVNEAGYNADYIFAISSGSAVLYANELFDITDLVIKELNDSYKNSTK